MSYSTKLAQYMATLPLYVVVQVTPDTVAAILVLTALIVFTIHHFEGFGFWKGLGAVLIAVAVMNLIVIYGTLVLVPYIINTF